MSERTIWRVLTVESVYMRRVLVVLVLLGAVTSSACGAARASTPTPNVFRPTPPAPTPYPTPTPLPSPTSLPVAALVANVGGWRIQQSQHWTGYTFPDTNVTGVQAQWVEPGVSGSPNSEEFVWIGLGGWNYASNNIVQVGTFAYIPAQGGHAQGIWYETVPTQQKAQFPLIDVSPGDRIFASVVEVTPSPQTWQLLLVDATTGATFNKIVQFDSFNAYPSFVVEDPNAGAPGPNGPFYTFPRWDTLTFSNMQVRLGKSWVSAAALFSYRIMMVRNGQVLASAGPLTRASSFEATQT